MLLLRLKRCHFKSFLRLFAMFSPNMTRNHDSTYNNYDECDKLPKKCCKTNYPNVTYPWDPWDMTRLLRASLSSCAVRTSCTSPGHIKRPGLRAGASPRLGRSRYDAAGVGWPFSVWRHPGDDICPKGPASHRDTISAQLRPMTR